MIPTYFVNKFLNEPRDDHRWLKQLSAREVDELIDSLRPRPKLWPGLDLHQKVAFFLGVAYNSFSFWLDMGSGKTLVALELMKYWRQCGDLRSVIVFVLSDKAYLTWERQVKRFKIDLPIVALEGSSVDKWDQLERSGQNGITLLTYGGAVAMCSTAVKKKGNKGKKVWKLDNELIDRLGHNVDMLVMDESTRAGHDTSLTYKLCQRLANSIEHRYALAGRPFGRDPIMLWAQQRLIDDGESLGPTKALFQEAFYSKEQNRFARSAYVFDYTFKKAMMPQLASMMQHRSITYEEREFQSVKKVRRVIEPVRFDVATQEHYLSAVNQLAQAKGDFAATKNIFLQMRQITSGFLGFKNDESGEKVQLAFANNPKLDRCLELIDELPLDRKAVIFYEYTWSAKQIVDHLKNVLSIKHIWLWSGTPNARASITRFLQQPECRVAVIQNKVGAYSLDGLQEVANYTFVYESPVSVIDREQLEKRLNRKGQKRMCYVYDLVVQGSVDERILQFHKEGRDLIAESRKNPRILFGGKS